LQVHAERDASQLGVVDGLAPNGNPVYDQQGEMVITKPFPNMPVGFWGPGGEQRYHEAYYEAFPQKKPILASVTRAHPIRKDRGTESVHLGRAEANAGGVQDSVDCLAIGQKLHDGDERL
jgi:acetoacetyl-CoA synthetase